MRTKLVAAAAASIAALAVAGTASAAADPGQKVFQSAGCGACHAMKAAGAKGTVGPSLDKTKPTAKIVTDRVTKGKGIMPAFKGRLSAADIKAVSSYVAKNAGRK